ncbi:gliding motility-associated C-terminal domain-containing protein [Salibacteraceae bacterium]|nr:gliding motility-associated C-terminal domain-containing protein [Salibacteraceae bacterium]
MINADYNGNAVQLRRSSDNALADFGFLNGELNVAAIESWAGVSTIYVRTLYDQSGSSRDVVQTTNNRQPTLVLTSAYGAPIIHFTNSQQLRYTVNYMFQKPFTLVTAAKTTGSNNGRVFGSYHQNWLHGFWGNRINVAHYEGWRVYPGITSSSGWQVPYIHTMWKANQTNWNFYSNATVQSKSNSNAGTDPRGFTLNGSGNLYELSNVDIMEVIMFDDTLAPVELENVQTSIANRFGITTAYGAPSAGNVGGGGSYEYLWSNGDSTNTIDVSPISTTTYYVTITDGFAECYDSITVTIVDPNFTFTNDTILSCGSDTVNVSAGSTWDNYLWSNGDTTETTSITSSGVYSLTVSNNGQCETWDTVTVSVINTNSGSNDTTICIGDSISINSQIFVSSDTIAFNYTGTDQTFTVPSGVTSINVLAWGAGGGKGGYSSSYAGGSGGFSSGTIAVTPGQQLKVVVGQGGIGQGVGLFTSGGSATYGGGGYGTYGDASGASGGGLTGLFLGAASMTFDASGQSRALLIAGGGGGTCAYSGGGGAGGGTNAGETTGGNGATSNAAGTGTNGDDGSPLKGGNGDASGSQNSGSPDGGGGGGGYFGGEGGFSDARPGGGGSGYLHPTLVSSGVTTTGQNGPSNTSAIPPSTSNALYNTGIGYGAYSSSGSNGGNGKLIISFTGQSAMNYNWSTGDTTSTINVSPNTTTAFTVTISDGISSCIDTISITVNDPNFTFTNDTVLATCFADSVTVDAGAVWVGYNWSTGETTQTKVCTATGPYSLTVTDNGGCTSSDTVNVSVINPVLAQGDTMICINTSATVGYNALTNISFLWSNSNTSPSISVSPVVTSNYTVTVSDGISSCIDTIAIYIDTISPTVFPHSNVNVYLNSSGQATLSAFIADSATSDNCLIDSIYLSNTSFDCANIGSNPTLLYALDNNGNLDSAQFIVSIIDPIAPVVITQNVTLYLDASGAANLTAIQVDNGSTDNCDIDTITLSNYNFVCADTGVNTIIVTVTDASGNAATQSAQITVMDTNSPIVMTQNVTIFLDVNGGATVTPSQVDLSSTDNCAIASMILSDSIFDCSDTVSANSITLSITDISGNSASANALITVLDTISPTAIAQNLTLFLDANGQAIAQASQVDNGSYDNCDVASLSLSDTIFNCADSGINTITLTVFDVSGNSSTATAQLLVVDTTSPSVITQNIIAYLDSSGQVIISWLDLDSASTDNCTIASSILSDSIFDCSDTGSINIVTLTMTDISGNSSSNDAQVIIIDSLPPVVITQNLTVYLDTNGVANITVIQINNGSYDNCGIDTMYLSNYSFDCNSNGLDTIILYVTDVSGNMSQNIAIVTVLETSAPVALAQNVTIYLDSNGSASVSPLVADSGSYDNCGIETYSLSDTTFTCNDVGENIVTFTVSDYSMNTSSVQIIITVLDTIKPVIYSQSPTVYLDVNGQAMLNVPQVDSGSYDNCSIGSIFLSDSLFNCGLVGVNDIYLMVSDVNGNIDSSIVSVTVADTIKPLVFAENYQAYLNLAGEFTLGVNLINASATDNCDVDSIYLSSTYFSCAHLGINYVSVYASDVNGNIGTIEIEVEILDTISPIITYCPEDIVSCDSIINYEIPMAEDNCLNVNSVLTNGIESGARFDIGITAIQYTMSDTMGNSVTCDFNVKRSGAPKITVSQDTTIFSGSVINLAVETDSVASSYYWTPEDYLDNPNSSNPTATPTESITYKVMVNSIDGCQQEDSVSILVLNEVTVYNAFSPNGDGQNDYLEINGLDYYIDCNVLIVNRLGAKVFESKGYSQPWNGKYKNKDMPVGAYFYFIDTGVPGAETLTGSISLIR